MKAHRRKTTLIEDGVLTLKDLPFKAGDAVEIIILEHHAKPLESNPYALRRRVYRYDDPFEPAVAVEDWEVLQ
jgi:hypothetical protein